MSEYWRHVWILKVFLHFRHFHSNIILLWKKTYSHPPHIPFSHSHTSSHPYAPSPHVPTHAHTLFSNIPQYPHTLTHTFLLHTSTHLHKSHTPAHPLFSHIPTIFTPHTALSTSLSSPTFLCTFIPQSVQINHSHAYPHSSSPISQCTTHYHFLTYLNFNLFFKVHWSPIFFIKLSRPPCLWFFFPRFLTQLVVLLVSRATALKYKLYCNIYCRFIENSLFN